MLASMSTFSLNDVRAVAKERDAWWTVLLVDPVAIRLTRLLARTPVTPDQITMVAFGLGIGAAACFAQADAGWLIAGALLYHLGFVLDCCDGKIARLKGTGSPFGGWLDFMLDRVRDTVCAIALSWGMFSATGEPAYLWMGFAILGLDMFRYLNASHMAKARRSMKAERARAARRAARLAEERHPEIGTGGPQTAQERADADAEAEEEEEEAEADGEDNGEPEPERTSRPQGHYARVRAYLLRHRIRMHLVSGIEFQMAAFIVGPVTGLVLPAVAVAGGMLLLFELALIFRFWRTARRFAANRKVNFGFEVPPQADARHDGADPFAVRVST